MTKYAIAIGLSGKIYENLIKTWKILEKEKKIKFISSRSPKPHIALTTGSAINEYKLKAILKKINIKKFKINSIGLALFIEKEPLLYLRWEKNKKLSDLFKIINKKTDKLLKKKSKFYNSSLWVPKTTIAWKDLKYSQLNIIIKKINFLLKKKSAIVCSLEFYYLTKKI